MSYIYIFHPGFKSYELKQFSLHNDVENYIPYGKCFCIKKINKTKLKQQRHFLRLQYCMDKELCHHKIVNAKISF